MAVESAGNGSPYRELTRTLDRYRKHYQDQVESLDRKQEKQLENLAENYQSNINESRSQFAEQTAEISERSRKLQKDLNEKKSARVQEIKDDYSKSLHDVEARHRDEQSQDRKIYGKTIKQQEKATRERFDALENNQNVIRRDLAATYQDKLEDVTDHFNEFKEKAKGDFNDKLKVINERNQESIQLKDAENANLRNQEAHRVQNQLESIKKSYGGQLESQAHAHDKQIKNQVEVRQRMMDRLERNNEIADQSKNVIDRRDHIQRLSRSHQEQLSKLQAENQNEVGDLRARTSNQLERLQTDYADQKENMEHNHDLERKRIRDQSMRNHVNHEEKTQKVVGQIRDDSMEGIKGEQVRFRDALEEKEKQFQKDLIRVKTDGRFRKDNDLLKEKNLRLERESEENLIRERSLAERRENDLKMGMQAQYDDLYEKFDHSKDHSVKSHQDDLKMMKKRFDHQLKENTHESLKSQSANKHRFDELIDETKIIERSRADKGITSAEERLKQRENTYHNDLVYRQEIYQDTLRQVQDAQKDELRIVTNDLKKQQNEIRMSMLEKVESIAEEARKKMSAMEFKHDIEVRSLKREHRGEIANLEKVKNAEKEAKVRELNQKLESQKGAFEHRLKLAQDEINKLHKKLEQRSTFGGEGLA